MGTKIYVGNLSYDTSEDTLKDLFNEYNPSSVTIIRYPDTGRSKGFGFAEFESADDANKAIEALNGQNVDGRDIVVNVAKERSESDSSGAPTKGNKLYVGNLSYDVDDSGLNEMFAKYGDISSASVIRFPDTGKSKGFGFVEFVNIEDADKALEMNGEEIDGRQIIVNVAKPKEFGARRSFDRY